jgi:hypothetical protein
MRKADYRLRAWTVERARMRARQRDGALEGTRFDDFFLHMERTTIVVLSFLTVSM